jgi:hypothetical protein
MATTATARSDAPFVWSPKNKVGLAAKVVAWRKGSF